MRELVLDGASWKSKDDVYDSFFTAVGAPSWHGRNLDALNDSIATGQINEIEVPYRLLARNYNQIGPGAQKFGEDFTNLIPEIARRGCSVEITMDAPRRERT